MPTTPTLSTGILQFTKPTYKITESGTWVGDRIAVSRTGGTSGIATVKVTAKTESATVGKDIEKVSVTLTWADGESDNKYVPVSVVQDAYEEGEETVQLILGSIKGAKYAPVKTAQLIIVDRASEAIAPNLINDDTLIALIPTLGGPKGVKFGDIKSLILQSIPTPPPPNPNPNPDPNPDPNPTPNPNPNPNPNPTPNPNPNPPPVPNPIPNNLNKSYQLNMATMLANGLSILANNITAGIDSLGEHLSFVKRSSSLTIKGIEENFNADFAIEIKLAIDPQYSNIMGVEPDGLLNLRPDGSNWCFDVGVGQNNVITIPNSVSGINSLDTIKIIRSNNVVTLDVNGVLASKPVTQTYNTANGLIIGNFNGFDGKLYGLKILTP